MNRADRRDARFRLLRDEPTQADLKALASLREFDFFFADDSRQSTPSRPEMGPLIGIGGLSVPAENISSLTSEINAICGRAGFSLDQEFKWSPGRGLSMHQNLVGAKRQSFFQEIITQLGHYQATVFVVIREISATSATDAPTPELDATKLFLERAQHLCSRNHSLGLVVVDRPGGGRSDEDKFPRDCLETIQKGTDYVQMECIVHNVVSTPSSLSRLLQAADLVIGSSVARVAGESDYSPSIFEALRPLFYSMGDHVGGYGLKIHPAHRYMNLYHWLTGDTEYKRQGRPSLPLPQADRLYSKDPYEP